MKTDSQLQQDVMAELTWEPAVQSTHIGVEVRGGVVTLAGRVDSYAEKLNAEHAAQRVSGVRAMTSELKVQPLGQRGRADADIASAVEHVLAWSSSLPERAIQVVVEGGWVTLTGQVNWQFQRQAAADSVRHLMGVTGVSDQIALKPSLSAKVVTSDIEAALKRTGIANAKTISVAVHGSDVTLSGTIQSWAERETATRAAWGSPGVDNVVDMLTLAHQ